MLHTIELFSVLLFIAMGEGVLAVGPHAVRRIVISMAGWSLAFAAGITILAIPSLAAVAVRLGLLFLAVCVVRWIVGELVQFLHGAELLAQPRAAELRELAQLVSALPEGECRGIARRIARRHDGVMALLGLVTMNTNEGIARDVFERAWEESSEKARALAGRIAEQRAKNARQDRARARDVLFVAQALCLYEQDSVERVLARLPVGLKGAAGRVEAVRQLARSGKQRKEAARLGLVPPSDNLEGGRAARRASPGQAGAGIEPVDVLWPPMGLVRAGFRKRAIALAISHGALVVYGAVALLCGRDSGWVFLAAALLIHVQAVFAIGDFNGLEARAKAQAGA
jgi:hypothetical protein